MISSGAAPAQHVEITPFLKFRLGDELGAFDTDDEYEVNEAFGYGLLLDIPVWENLQVEPLFSNQDTEVEAKGFSFDENSYNMEVQYYQVGLLRPWEWERVQTFLVSSAGLTRFEPQAGA